MNRSDWHPFDYELTLYFGEFALKRFVIPVQRKVFSLNEIRHQTGVPDLPPLPPGRNGYLLANIPEPCDEGSVTKVDGGLLRYCLKSYQRCYIDMAGGFDAYQARFSGKTRSGIKRKVKKFAENAGGLDFRSYRTPDEIRHFFALARPVSAASYQERLLDCGLPTEREYIERAVASAADDRVRGFLLFAHDKPVSYLYCPIEDGVLEYAYLGYVPEFSRLSPGTVLQWLAMEQLFAEKRFLAFDFTEGDSEHKRFFSTHQVPCSLQLMLQATLRQHLKLAMHRVCTTASAGFVGALARIGVKQRIKRWIRRVT